MAAPYWGQLPASKARRMSADEYSQIDDYDEPYEVPATTSQTTQNRASTQTAHTDAPTDSTFSPGASPQRSSFRGAGLAPRPPSLPYGQNLPSDFVDRRRRRSAKNQEEVPEETARATPPAAPEIPRAPPVSYKPRNGAISPYTFSASGQPGPPPSAHRSLTQAKATAPDGDYFKDATPSSERRNRAPVLDRSRQNFDDDGGMAAQRLAKDGDRDLERHASRSGSARRPVNGPRAEPASANDPVSPVRRGSVRTDAQQNKWADDRSPLQRLELTLDSITKEEKRARVEVAEQRARNRAKAAAGSSNGMERSASLSVPGAPQQARSRGPQQPNRRPRTDGEEDVRMPVGGQGKARRVVITDPLEVQPSATMAAASSRPPPPQNEQRRGSTEQAPRSQIPVAMNREMTAVRANELPKRNLSFRERAQNTDMPVPSEKPDAEIRGPPPVTTGASVPPPARSGSNKLKKNPPSEARYPSRVDSEALMSPAIRRAPDADQVSPTAAGVGRSNTTGATVKRSQHPPEEMDEPMPARQPQGVRNGPSTSDRVKAIGAANGLGRSVSLGANGRSAGHVDDSVTPRTPGGKRVAFPGHRIEDDEASGDEAAQNNLRGVPARAREFPLKERGPIQRIYQPPKYLDEWKKGTVGTLAGALLDVTAEVPAPPEEPREKDTAWWEQSHGRRGSISSRPKKAEAFDGEYDETQAPTRFKPSLHLKCGPLLRYCGIRQEKMASRSRGAASETTSTKEIWRGSVMIVTEDLESSYEIAPTLRLFVQPIDLLPPPPAELRDEQALQPEYVDPIAGLPKLGRRGETWYVRPVEHLEEAKDLSMLDLDEGLFESTRTAPDFGDSPDPPGSFASRRKRIQVDGEKLGKYKDVRGFRLHTERGCTFWRFNIEVELRNKQQRIAYRINRGPSTGFWVPAQGEAMNIMFHSCNGFSLSVKPDDLSGPDPMWRDVLNTHQTQPFHVMIGGGDQIYNDAVMREVKVFQDWLAIRHPLHKGNAPFTAEMQSELEDFYLDRYSMWFSQGLFGLANSQIPMVNMYDDHDIIDGFGSYPDHFMKSAVFSGLGAVAFKYYMLFQHQSVVDEDEITEPSWVLGCSRGPFIQELSRSLFMSMGGEVALLAVDARTERSRDEVVREDSWKKLIDRCYAEIVKGKTRHLLVLLGVPIAYPRLVWLENILTSRLMDPVKAIGKTGLFGKFLNRFDGGVEVLDDLDDHWTAKNHKDERKFVIEDLQDLAADKSVRITILSGDVHLAAVGQFYSNPKLGIAKHKDFRYMPNIVSSAIVNTPPPDLLADILNKRNKVHHFDKETDEDMIPIFTNGVDGKPRNNKRLLPHRNWCSIRTYVPGGTPPPTPPPEFDTTPDGTPPGSRAGGMLRRLSLSRPRDRGPAFRPDVPEEKDRLRPPVSGGFFRSLSRRGSTSDPDGRPGGPGRLVRTLSLGRGDPAAPKRSFFGRRPSADYRDDGGINGTWGDQDEDDDYYEPPPGPPPQQQQQSMRPPAYAPQSTSGRGGRMGLRGGAGNARDLEYETGDESQFTARPPQRAATLPTAVNYGGIPPQDAAFRPKPFHRTPTGLSLKQLKKHGAGRFEVDLEHGLEITLNVEVNAKDPSGITVPYRLLVPKLQYEYQGEDALGEETLGAHDARSDELEGADAGIEGPPLPPNANPGPTQQAPGPGPTRSGGNMGSIRRFFSQGRGGGGGGGSQYRSHRWGEDGTRWYPGEEEAMR